MSIDLAQDLDPRDLRDRLSALESQIETLQDNTYSRKSFYEESLQEVQADTQAARRSTSTAHALSLIVLFLSVTMVALTLRAKADLEWELYLENTRAESLANRIGQLSAQLTQSQVHLKHAQELLVNVRTIGSPMTHGHTSSATSMMAQSHSKDRSDGLATASFIVRSPMRDSR